MGETKDRLSGMRIGFVGKGGSGKSTVSVLMAHALRARGHDVCFVDADSTNVGVDGALGLEREPEPLIDYFGGAVFGGGAVTCPVDDPTRLSNAAVRVSELPERYRGRTHDGIDVLAIGKVGRDVPGAGCDGPVAKIARDLRIESPEGDPVTLIDFKAGLEDSARGVLTGLDWVVVVVDPTRAAIEMAVDMVYLVRALRAGATPATEHLNDPSLVELANRIYRGARIDGASCLLNRVRDVRQERFLRERLAVAGIAPIGVIAEDVGISDAWMRGVRLADGGAGIDRIAAALETALEAATGSSSRSTVGAG